MIVNDWNNNTYLEEYWDGIKSGEIVVCSLMKKTIRNLIRDMENPRYTYNTFDADIRINFIESCCFMTKNEYYGQLMKLELFQKVFITALYSFKMTRTMRRRFKRALLLIARKNGKTEFISALLYAEFNIGQSASELIVGSCNNDTANIIYDAFNTMRTQADPKNQQSWKNQLWIKNLVNQTKVFKLSDRNRSNDGHNAYFGVIDESHELLTDELANSILQSQSLQQEPLFINITTEGFVDSGYLDSELDKCIKIINGEDDSRFAESYLPFLFMQDGEQEIWDITEEELEECEATEKQCVLHKSNPTLGRIKTYDYIIGKMQEAKQSKSVKASVLAKDFNVKSSQNATWLLKSEIENDERFDLEDFRGCWGVSGEDLAETTDLSCVSVLLFKPGTSKKYLHQMYFMPRAKLQRADDKSEGAKYEEWEKEGLIRFVDGNDFDSADVADYLAELYNLYGIKILKSGYDQKFAKQFTNRAEALGIETELVMQNAQTLSNPMKMLENDLLDKKLVYNNNPITKWCLENTAIKTDGYDKSMPVKVGRIKAKRIDGTSSLINAYEMYNRYRNDLKEANGF